MMKHGGDRTVKEQGDNITLLKKARGTDPEYCSARIKRDRPDIAADVAAVVAQREKIANLLQKLTFRLD